MATALGIAQVVARSLGLSAVSTLVGGGQTADTMLVQLNRGGRALAAKRGPWGGSWRPLMRELTLIGLAGQTAYDLPEDLVDIVPGTVWDRDSSREASGPLTPRQTHGISANSPGAWSMDLLWRLAATDGGHQQIVFSEEPSDGAEIALEYVSGLWVRESPAAAPTRAWVVSDTDVPALPEHLVELDLEWRMRKSLGLPFAADLGEFELERDRQFALHTDSPTIRLGAGILDDPDLPANIGPRVVGV